MPKINLENLPVAEVQQAVQMMSFERWFVLVFTGLALFTILWLSRRLGGYLHHLLVFLVAGILTWGLAIVFETRLLAIALNCPYLPTAKTLYTTGGSLFMALGAYVYYRGYIKATKVTKVKG